MNFLLGSGSSLYIGEIVCHAISVSYENVDDGKIPANAMTRKSQSFVVQARIKRGAARLIPSLDYLVLADLIE